MYDALLCYCDEQKSNVKALVGFDFMRLI